MGNRGDCGVFRWPKERSSLHFETIWCKAVSSGGIFWKRSDQSDKRNQWYKFWNSLWRDQKITKEKVSSYFSDKGPTYHYSWQIANVNCTTGWTASDHSQKNAVAASQRISIVSGWKRRNHFSNLKLYVLWSCTRYC